MSFLGLVFSLGIFVTGCHVQTRVTYYDPYLYPAWTNVYGDVCGYEGEGPRAGCNYYYSDGYKIILEEDPYYYSSFYGFELAEWWYINDYGYESVYIGWGWLSPNGILYDDYGNALNEDGENESRDDLANFAQKENQVITSAGKAFAQKYALAENKGIEIARTLNSWATLVKNNRGRTRTKADAEAFSKKLYGVELSQAENALAEMIGGNESPMMALNQDVAAYWSTNPETSSEILKDFYNKELAKLKGE